MTTLIVTANGKTYSYEASAEQLAGLGAIVASINAKVPAKEDGSPGDPTYATDLALLQESIADWVAANPGSSDEVVVAKIGSTLDSWAGLPAPPEPVAATMSDEAKKAALLAFASETHRQVLEGGVTVNGVIVSTTPAGRVDMAGAVSLAQLVPSHTFDWVCTTGPVSLSAAQVIALGTAVGLWVQSTYTTYGTAVAGINAGTITTQGQINSASWPSNVIS